MGLIKVGDLKALLHHFSDDYIVSVDHVEPDDKGRLFISSDVNVVGIRRVPGAMCISLMTDENLLKDHDAKAGWNDGFAAGYQKARQEIVSKK